MRGSWDHVRRPCSRCRGPRRRNQQSGLIRRGGQAFIATARRVQRSNKGSDHGRYKIVTDPSRSSRSLCRRGPFFGTLQQGVGSGREFAIGSASGTEAENWIIARKQFVYVPPVAAGVGTTRTATQ